ncbi:hypothetical protein MFIFM68171_06451 [Madurella fahalii]|uniref:C2H2-type domain-containing protein n=1 Tax=Madurella fahalii TaxID=1157608 RepID=A0ABQ0GER6_9PEZI
MASLKFIMDVNDDHQIADGLPPHNKRDKGASKLASAGQLQEPPTNQHADPRHVSSPDLATEQDINQAAPAAQPKRRGAGPAATISSSSSSPPSSLSAPTTRPSARRRSTTSNDSMEPRRYGSVVSPSSTSGGPQRPVRMHPAPAQLPTRITPKTGRVSKAQKGLPVHVCTICKPPKTFTRAEHLRRHQLSHAEPRFQCPNCERAFHRADLLTRHQQKHNASESEDDQAAKSGSVRESPHLSPAAVSRQAQQSPHSPSAIVAGSGPGLAPSPSATEIPPTPSAGISGQARFSQVHRNSPVYTVSDSGAFRLSPDHTIINPTQPSPLTRPYPGGPGPYQPPRSEPLYVVTQGIPQPSLQPAGQPPDLQDTSPWPSSASDSAYSTPSDGSRNTRHWMRGHRSPTDEWGASQRLSPYPPPGSRGPQAPQVPMTGASGLQPSLFVSSYTSNAQSQDQHFGGAMLGVSSLGFSGPAGHHSSLSGSSDSTLRPPHHRQHGNSISSIRSQTPPLNTAPHARDSLIAPIPTVPSRLGPLAGVGHRKRMMVAPHQDLMGQGAIGGMDVLGGLDMGYGGSGSVNAASPGGDNSNHSSGIVAGLDLAMVDGCAMPISAAMTIPLPGPVRAAIPGYLEVYWARVDPLLPFVHRQSFEVAPEDVLKCAMAAVATQYLDNKDDRARGNQLHEYAWQEVKRVPRWSLQVMQAILLCEYFARFRGRKAVTRPSKPFESLYSRVLYHNPALLDSAMLVADQHLPAQDRWRNWLEAESRRRLLAACLFCDGHAAIYQQQRRVQDAEAGASAALQLVPLLGRSAKLWEASSADEWANALAADPGAAEPDLVPPVEQLTPEDIEARPVFDQMIMLGVCALHLPRRQRSQGASVSATNSPAPELDPHTQHVGSQFGPDQQPHFLRQIPEAQDTPYLGAEDRINTLFGNYPVANTYLALHHTPLRDLLAVGGDSWAFSQKVLPAALFSEHQRRLGLWVKGDSAAKATVYAARAILGFLERQPTPNSAAGSAPWSTDLADYWALSVCALICWAFNHRARGNAPSSSSSSSNPAEAQQQHQQQQSQWNRQRSSSGGRSGGSSPASGASGVVFGAGATTDDEALAWLRMVAAEGVGRARGRREAGGVVGLVRRRLESDCVGGQSMLYVDAIAVLRKIEEGVGWKWF